jgi:hypothetical protein
VVPGLKVYASDAITGALTGFLARSAKDSAGYLNDPQIPEAMREDIRADLVTLPARFLDTACPEGWEAALRDVAAAPFEVAIPGHGAAMTRSQFERYRSALGAFLECTNSVAPEGECATRWADSVESLLADGPAEKPRARGIAEYYVGMLRANGGRSKYCKASADGLWVSRAGTLARLIVERVTPAPWLGLTGGPPTASGRRALALVPGAPSPLRVGLAMELG